VPIAAPHSSIVNGSQPCATKVSHQARYNGISESKISPSKSNTSARIIDDAQ
jgi:hypothetical protein